MRLVDIRIKDVRMLGDVAVEPDPSTNLLIGPNGSGKTSFLEAIHILSLGRSFRTRKARSVIRHDADTLAVSGRVEEGDGGRGCTIGIEKGVTHTRLRLDGGTVRSVSLLARRLPVMVISPEGFKALLEGSEHRRRILDWTLFHVEPSYLRALQRYEHVLKQRNAVLRLPWGVDVDRELDAWDDQLAVQGESLDAMRRAHIESSRLAAITEEMIGTLLGEQVTWSYWSGWDRGGSLRDTLADQRARDRQVGFTRVGPHRADVIWRAARSMARESLSRGQGRLLVMAFELAQAAYVKVAREGVRPLLLVDDLSTELDIASMQRFLSRVETLGLQVFITSVLEAIVTIVRPVMAARVFHVERGEVRPGR